MCMRLKLAFDVFNSTWSRQPIGGTSPLRRCRGVRETGPVADRQVFTLLVLFVLALLTSGCANPALPKQAARRSQPQSLPDPYSSITTTGRQDVAVVPRQSVEDGDKTEYRLAAWNLRDEPSHLAVGRNAVRGLANARDRGELMPVFASNSIPAVDTSLLPGYVLQGGTGSPFTVHLDSDPSGVGAMYLGQMAQAPEDFDRWTVRLDMGGVIPEDATLREFGGPVSGERLKLDPGFQFDLALGYRIRPWLEVGPELGFTFNGVDSIGGWSYPNTILGQILMMGNVRLEYPAKSRLAAFAGGGIGGVASFLTFGGDNDYYDYDDHGADGTGSDLVWAYQAFGGLRYRVADKWSLGLEYRFLHTDPQRWDVDWWNGPEFAVGINSLRMHSVCLMLSGTF